MAWQVLWNSDDMKCLIYIYYNPTIINSPKVQKLTPRLSHLWYRRFPCWGSSPHSVGLHLWPSLEENTEFKQNIIYILIHCRLHCGVFYTSIMFERHTLTLQKFLFDSNTGAVPQEAGGFLHRYKKFTTPLTDNSTRREKHITAYRQFRFSSVGTRHIWVLVIHKSWLLENPNQHSGWLWQKF